MHYEVHNVKNIFNLFEEFKVRLYKNTGNIYWSDQFNSFKLRVILNAENKLALSYNIQLNISILNNLQYF